MLMDLSIHSFETKNSLILFHMILQEGSMEVVVNKVPRKFWELEPALRKLSFEVLMNLVGF